MTNGHEDVASNLEPVPIAELERRFAGVLDVEVRGGLLWVTSGVLVDRDGNPLEVACGMKRVTGVYLRKEDGHDDGFMVSHRPVFGPQRRFLYVESIGVFAECEGERIVRRYMRRRQ